MRRLLATFALLLPLIAGCGDDDDDGRTVTVAGDEAIAVVADEYSFDPDTVVYESSGSDAPLRITLDNRGALAHNLKVLEGEREHGGTPTFPGGREESGTVELAPGEYRMVCTVGDHEELGMTGTLRVR